ncbi:hypothetical protein O181_017429 [Austropuccinia psidii MF-1]|uniref:Uncharacterized protein n=1 Tax=Austropuccinia psidii MF-1 TaxID=1389203 RepID=A0A9Q3GSR8_9BASI|nr:hypothetical protein [Austropuccinia psidii MF-1]
MYCGMPPYSCPGSQASHSNPYACSGYRNLTLKALCCKSLHRGSLPTMPTIPYSCPGSRHFTPKSLRLCRFLTIQKLAYSRAGFQQLTCKSLRLYRFPMLHMQNPDACTGSGQFTPFLTPGNPPKNSKNALHN